MSEERLTNIVTSMNPCPICAGINGMTMTLAEWEASAYGLPGSDGRYCDGSCHCILIPDALLDKFDWIDPNFIPRGDPGSDVGPIIEIFPNEKALADLMNEWNLKFGRLPQEIYQMPVKDGWAYLKKLYDHRIAGGVPPSAPPPPVPIAPPVPIPPAPIAPPAAPAPTPQAAAKATRSTAKVAKLTAAELKIAKTKSAFAGEGDAFIKAQAENERTIWALNERAKQNKGPAKGHGREHAFAIDADGNVLFFKRGKLTTVDYTWEEMYEARTARAWTHNHPSVNGVPSAFSMTDIGYSAWGNFDKQIVISYGRRYTLFRPAGGWYPGQAADIAELWRIYESQGENSWDFRMQTRKIDRECQRMKAESDHFWRLKKPSDARLEQERAEARKPFEDKVKAARAEYDRLAADANSNEAERSAAWKKYGDLNTEMSKAGALARERYFYAALDEAIKDYAAQYNIKFTIDEWD